MKELLVRVLYCEMLGHPVPFAYIHALNMTQQKRLIDKRIGNNVTVVFFFFLLLCVGRQT